MTYQLTAPLLDACVLGVVESEDVYGYTLTQRVMDVVDISESTLYPVLRRRQKSGLLTTYDRPYQGRNRRYYSITTEGSSQLRFFRNEWEAYKKNIDMLIGPGTGTGSRLTDTMTQQTGTGSRLTDSMMQQTVTGMSNGSEINLTLYSGYNSHSGSDPEMSGNTTEIQINSPVPDNSSNPATEMIENNSGNTEGGTR